MEIDKRFIDRWESRYFDKYHFDARYTVTPDNENGVVEYISLDDWLYIVSAERDQIEESYYILLDQETIDLADIYYALSDLCEIDQHIESVLGAWEE